MDNRADRYHCWTYQILFVGKNQYSTVPHQWVINNGLQPSTLCLAVATLSVLVVQSAVTAGKCLLISP